MVKMNLVKKKIFVLIIFCFFFFFVSETRGEGEWWVRKGKPGDRLKVDLNGDGRADVVEVEREDENGEFVLRVGRATVSSRLENGPVSDFGIVDLREGDGFVEVFVHTEGPSADDEYVFFRYRDGALVELGRVERWVRKVKDGELWVDDWMGFWTRHSVYLLRNERLVEVKREFFYVGVEGRAEDDLHLRLSFSEPSVSVRIRRGRVVRVVGWKPEEKKAKGEELREFGGWYFLWSEEEGVGGWCRLKDFYDKVKGLNWAD